MKHFLFSLAIALLLPTACGDRTHADGVGNTCEEDDDCETGDCYIGPDGGYCTAPCGGEGETADCPADTVCKPIQGGPARCLLVCGSESACDDRGGCDDDECPAGSGCVDVSDTDLRACEPNP